MLFNPFFKWLDQVKSQASEWCDTTASWQKGPGAWPPVSLIQRKTLCFPFSKQQRTWGISPVYWHNSQYSYFKNKVGISPVLGASLCPQEQRAAFSFVFERATKMECQYRRLSVSWLEWWQVAQLKGTLQNWGVPEEEHFLIQNFGEDLKRQIFLWCFRAMFAKYRAGLGKLIRSLWNYIIPPQHYVSLCWVSKILQLYFVSMSVTSTCPLDKLWAFWGQGLSHSYQYASQVQGV